MVPLWGTPNVAWSGLAFGQATNCLKSLTSAGTAVPTKTQNSNRASWLTGTRSWPLQAGILIGDLGRAGTHCDPRANRVATGAMNIPAMMVNAHSRKFPTVPCNRPRRHSFFLGQQRVERNNEKA